MHNQITNCFELFPFLFIMDKQPAFPNNYELIHFFFLWYHIANILSLYKYYFNNDLYFIKKGVPSLWYYHVPLMFLD